MVKRRSVWAVTALAAALALPAAVADAMEPAERDEVERLFIEGQEHYARGEFVAAGDRWAELLALLPENEDNRRTRENVLLNVVRARIDAYSRQLHDNRGSGLQQLERARAQLDAYQAELRAAYGEDAQWSAAVQRESDELARVHEPIAPLGPEERERLFAEGRERYEEGRYEEAADVWTELFRRVPEQEDDRVLRESVLLDLIQARLDAFHHTRTEDKDEQIREQLDPARALLDEYRVELKTAYGEDAVWSAAVQERFEELEAVYHQASDEYLHPCLTQCLSPCLQPCLNVIEPRRGCHGCGNDDDYSGMAMLGLMFVPALRRRRRREVIDGMADRLPPDVVARLRAREGDDDEPV